MNRRWAVPVVCLAVGAAAGAGGAVYFRQAATAPAPIATPAAAPAPQGDDAVVEIRVRIPAGKGGPGALAKESSGLPRGGLVNTQNPLDLAIEGDGFFQVMLPDGATAYTRRGNFGRSAVGAIATPQGYHIHPQITVPTNTVGVSIGADGTVSAQTASSPNVSTILGQFVLARFANPGWLRTDADGLFHETERSGPPTLATAGQNAVGFVRQGFRERHPDQLPAALVELVRELAQQKDDTTDGNGVRVQARN